MEMATLTTKIFSKCSSHVTTNTWELLLLKGLTTQFLAQSILERKLKPT
jgi:hypothetical protein